MIEIKKRARKDLARISSDVRENILKQIYKKLGSNPILFSSCLRGNFREFRKFRVGNYRVIFKINNDVINIHAIDTRSNIYGLSISD